MMTDPGTPKIVEITLRPGEFHFGGGYTRIHTLLGSCVAITLWHPQKHIGGMCHYLLPRRGTSRRLTRGHYADDAIELFLEEMRQAGTRPHEYEVKLFGGGSMFETHCQVTGPVNVSRNNIEAGMQMLQEHGFTVKAQDVGGINYRKIYLELWNGGVWVQHGPRVTTERCKQQCQ